MSDSPHFPIWTSGDRSSSSEDSDGHLLTNLSTLDHTEVFSQDHQMPECALTRRSSSSGHGIFSEDSEDLVTNLRQLARGELDMGDNHLPLQLPPQPPLDAPAPLPGANPGDPSTTVGPVLKEPIVRFDSLYRLSTQILGNGRFASVRKCTDRRSGKQFACKVVLKGLPGTTMNRLRDEIKILHYLSGVPHIIKFERAYEDHYCVYLIMELCEGGRLLKKVIDAGRLVEQSAQEVFRQMIQAVHYCHLMGVMHLDIKPENVLFADRSIHPSVRLVDFGISRFFKEGRKYRYRRGTPMYTAPEVLRRSFGKEADVWSSGIVLYILLCGKFPFPTTYRNSVPRKAIMRGDFDMEREPWPYISGPAKDLIRKMLNTNPDRRITTAQILEHPWVREEGVSLPAQLPPIFEFFTRLRRIREMKFLRRLGLMVMVGWLSPERTRDCKRVLASIRAGEGGVVSFKDFLNKAFVLGSEITEQELRVLVDLDDYKGEGQDPLELMAAMLPSDWYGDEQMLEWVFNQLRKEGAWYINKESLYFYIEMLFQHEITKEFVEEALLEVGVHPGGHIDRAKFLKIMGWQEHRQSWMTQIGNRVQCCIS